MARENVWTNNDGLEVSYGPIVSGNKYTGSNHIKGKIKQMEVRVEFDNLQSVGDAHTAKDMFIPAGAQIVSAIYNAEEDFDNAVEFGTAEQDGTAIDQDGLIATGTTSAVGAGALIGTTVALDSYIVVTATTTAPGAGKGTLVVEYTI